jgi:putative glutamine amidotransferase
MRTQHQRRPIIGITPDIISVDEKTPFAKLDLKLAYCDAIARAGGLPMVLPMSEDAALVDSFLERISGLVVTGGAFDVPPDLYGETPREGLGPLKPWRTQFELKLLRGCISRRLPVLGICGGMQLINVHFGGTLFQDLSREFASAKCHEQTHDRSQPQHPVEVVESTWLCDALGKGQLMVNSTHHQAVNKLGNGLTASAISNDGVIEAIESKEHQTYGVQWHPELMCDTVPPHFSIYKSFVGRCRAR